MQPASFRGVHPPTVFDTYSANVMVQQRSVSLCLVDTAGGVRSAESAQLPQTDVMIVCFALDNPVSCDNVRSKFDVCHELKRHAPKAPILAEGSARRFWPTLDRAAGKRDKSPVTPPPRGKAWQGDSETPATGVLLSAAIGREVQSLMRRSDWLCGRANGDCGISRAKTAERAQNPSKTASAQKFFLISSSDAVANLCMSPPTNTSRLPSPGNCQGFMPVATGRSARDFIGAAWQQNEPLSR
uniref:Tr-type G domain-containing protein n=1 Tax=Macrostomum lignano TaxID=282301 RepID=A0A1I8FNC7_9PLAT